MAPNPRRIDQRLQALYDRVPRIDCIGRCHGACCFVDPSVRERQRLRETSGRDLGTRDILREPGNQTRFDDAGNLLARYRCTMLTDNGRCGAYEARPMICRLWGTAELMECGYGCEPERLLSFGEAVELLVEAMHVGGNTWDWLGSSADARKAAEANPEFFAEFMRRHRRL